PYDPNSVGEYQPGQVVIYNGSSYVVNKPSPQGIPGQSPDYTLLASQGPTGPTGPITTTNNLSTAGTPGIIEVNGLIPLGINTVQNGTAIMHINNSDTINLDPNQTYYVAFNAGASVPAGTGLVVIPVFNGANLNDYAAFGSQPTELGGRNSSGSSSLILNTGPVISTLQFKNTTPNGSSNFFNINVQVITLI
ncbi:hypothetical protein II5_05954, partial [Bacillus cereus MSX-A1]